MHEELPRHGNPAMTRRTALLLTGLAGFLAQTVQIVLLRELMVAFSGLEIVLGVALGAWMGLVAAGGGLGALLSSKARNPGLLLASMLSMSFPLLAASAILARVAPAWLGLASGQLPGIAASLGLALPVLTPTCLFVGALFVVSSKALEAAGGGTGAVGYAYLAEAAGSALAGASFSFVMVRFLNPFHVIALSAAVAGVAGAYWLLRNAPRAWAVSGTLGALAAVLALGLAGPMDRATAARRWREAQRDQDIVAFRDSRYGRIAVTRYRGQTNYFVSGHLAFSLPDREGASALAHSALCEHPSPRRILLVGGGVAGLVREALKHRPERVDTVELDPLLVRTARETAPKETAELDDPRVRVLDGDGRAFLKRAPPGSYDFVLVNVPDPETAGLNRYYTVEFFEELRRALAQGGVACFTISGASNYLGSEILARNGAIYHGFQAVFPHVLVWPGETFLYFGTLSPGVLTHDPDALARRFGARNIAFPWVCPKCGGPDRARPGTCPGCGSSLVESAWFTGHHFWMRLNREDVFRVNRALRRWPVDHEEAREEDGEGGKDDLPPFMRGEEGDEPPSWLEPVPPAQRKLNTDSNPSAYLQDLLLWNRVMEEGGWALAVRTVTSVAGGFWALVGAAFCLPLLAWVVSGRGKARRGPFRFALAAVVACVGFAELAFEMVILLAFQSQYGYVYGEMGVLFGAFMLGLGLGSWVSLRKIPVSPVSVWVVIGITAAFGIGLPPLLSLLGSLSSIPAFLGYLCLTLLAGLPVGLVFPLAAKLYPSGPGAAQRTASVLYGADLAGGIAGALLVSPLFLPALGLEGALWFEVVPLLGVAALVLGAGAWLARGRSEQAGR